MRTRDYLRIATILLLFGGCQPGDEDRLALKSRFFDHVEVIGRRGGGAGEFNKPRSLALDLHDNLFVVDITGRVQKFSPTGAFLLSWQMPQTDLGKPKGMGRDDQGNIVVIEPHYSRVNFFSEGGRLLKQWGVPGTNAGQLGMPRSVAVTRRGEIYLSEYGHVERVQKFTADGKPSWRILAWRERDQESSTGRRGWGWTPRKGFMWRTRVIIAFRYSPRKGSLSADTATPARGWAN